MNESTEKMFAEMQVLSREVNALMGVMESKMKVWDGKDEESIYKIFRDRCIVLSRYYELMADSAAEAKLDGVKFREFTERMLDI